MSYPLNALPTIPDDVAKMDSRERLKFEMAFMKNVFVQALNTLYKLAPAVEASRSAFVPFLDYAGMTCAFLLLHFEGDRIFFTTPGEEGKAIQEVVGSACNPPMEGAASSLKKLQALIEQLRKTPDVYTASAFRAGLGFGPHMLEHMRLQVASIDSKRLREHFSEEAMNKMMFDNMTWFGQQAGVEALIPYIVSHHDTSTSKFWPCIPSEALAALPELVKNNSASWKFAPVHPTTKVPSPWAV